MIQMTVFGLGIFTKEPSERFHYRGPPGSEEPGSDNFSLISNTFARKTLREACQAVSDSLEFDEAIDEAVSSVEEGFDFGIQHKLCLQLNYCKVKNKRGKRQSQRPAAVWLLSRSSSRFMHRRVRLACSSCAHLLLWS